MAVLAWRSRRSAGLWIEILDTTLGGWVVDGFFHDRVFDLGSKLGAQRRPDDRYSLVADMPGGFGIDFAVGGAVPEPSTWAMMLLGFAGLGYAGYRTSQKAASIAA
jgi:hypothetical protein